MPDDTDLLRLAWCGLAPRRVTQLMGRFGDPTTVIAAMTAGRIDVDRRIVAAAEVEADQRRAQLAAIGASFVPRGTTSYPTALDRYPGSPPWLFRIGEIADTATIAIVGTRACTAYGTELAGAYGSVAATAGWSVVSGLARGIDGAAHRGAVGERGHCAAVFGAGIDVVYPRRHRALLADILGSGGCALSEFPPGTRPDGWRFPTRNRIIAGLADLVLVVEAGATGGALITARIAIDYGLPVLATPGDVDRRASVGTNQLIRDGAFPVFGPDDLAATLDLVTPLVRDQACTHL
jgi:DNA processing protein